MALSRGGECPLFASSSRPRRAEFAAQVAQPERILPSKVSAQTGAATAPILAPFRHDYDHLRTTYSWFRPIVNSAAGRLDLKAKAQGLRPFGQTPDINPEQRVRLPAREAAS